MAQSVSTANRGRGRSVLVTGAGGFIGGHCLPRLVDEGYEVHALSRGDQSGSESRGRSVDGLRGRAGDVVWHVCDLLDSVATSRLVREIGPTHLLHLAWIATPGEYWTSPVNLAWLRASLDLAEAFAEAGGVRAVVAGTCAEYDWSEGVCSEETTRLNPVSIYGASKMSLQLCLSGLWKSSGPDLCWGRIFFPYGPGEDDRKLVASVCRSLMSGAMAECSAGNQQRDFIHAGDVASALVSLLATDVEGPVNIGSGAAVSVRNLVCAVAERMGAPGRVRFGSVKRDDESAPLVVADISRLLATGWTPEFTLESGITDTVKWWLANEELAHAG